MKFQRARSEEQKTIRIQQILASANELLNQYPYKDITMDMIAEGLQFSRANIARYASTKEEIFMKLYLEDMLAVCEELIGKCREKGELGISEFAALFAGICAGHTNFIRLGAILDTIIEMNIKVERLAEYKKTMLLKIEDVVQQLLVQFPFLTYETACEIVSILTRYLAGLYPGGHQSPAQKEAIRLSGIPYHEEDFHTSLVRFIEILLSGYQALYSKQPAQ